MCSQLAAATVNAMQNRAMVLLPHEKGRTPFLCIFVRPARCAEKCARRYSMRLAILSGTELGTLMKITTHAINMRSSFAATFRTSADRRERHSSMTFDRYAGWSKR